MNHFGQILFIFMKSRKLDLRINQSGLTPHREHTHVHGRLLPHVKAQHRQETGGGPQLFPGHGDEHLEAADARGDWRVPQ